MVGAGARGRTPSEGKLDAVCVVGVPGAGKTTLARHLADALTWDYLGTGELLRKAVQDGDRELGALLARGELAPEWLVRSLLRQRFQEPPCAGVVVDGFPRHADQISLANELLGRWAVLHLDISGTDAAQRISGRSVCSRCGTHPPTAAARCPLCGSTELEARPEDRRSTSHRRIEDAQAMLDGMFRRLHKIPVLTVDASKPALVVAEDTLTVLGAFQRGAEQG
jgi:adenylate kinase